MPKAKQARLPGTEDGPIQELEDAAEKYADIRDKRMALTSDESLLKKELLRMLKKNKLKRYHRDGIEIDIVAEEETVKVRVKKPEAEEAAAE